ncbi:hypothetical protein BHE74_00057388 [Ensete ventricosum]|nr:hypothetical protein BHE74_00057388 [Ensete ventricosum]
MRIMLDKVPEGEWLCEECQLKEAENQLIGKSEAQFEAVEAPCLDTDSQNIDSTSKSLPCVENKAVDQDIKIDNKELVGDRLQHFQRCKETDHSTQFCAVDKLRISAVKPSSEQSLRDMDNRSIKSKDAVDILSWKLGTKRSARPPDQSEEVSLSGTDVNSESTSSDFTSNFLSSGNLPMVEGAADVHNFCEATNSIHMKQKMDDRKKTTICSREGASPDAADDLNMKPIIQILLDQASFPTHPLKASVIPEFEGAFEVLRTANPPALFDGIQAHLSDRSPKAKSSKFGNCIDLQNIPTTGDENEVLNSEQPLVQKTFHQAIADDEVLTEQASCSLPASCSLKNISQLPSTLVSLKMDMGLFPPLLGTSGCFVVQCKVFRTAWYGRYIPVRWFTGTALYWAVRTTDPVTVKIDRYRPCNGQNDRYRPCKGRIQPLQTL